MSDWKDSVHTQQELYDIVEELRQALGTAHRRAEQLEADRDEMRSHLESLQNKYAQATAEIENLEKHQQYLLSVLEDYAAVTGMDPAQVLAKRKEAPSDE